MKAKGPIQKALLAGARKFAKHALDAMYGNRKLAIKLLKRHAKRKGPSAKYLKLAALVLENSLTPNPVKKLQIGSKIAFVYRNRKTHGTFLGKAGNGYLIKTGNDIQTYRSK